MELDRKLAVGLVGGFVGYSAFGYFGGLDSALAALVAFAVAWVIGYPLGWIVGYYLTRDADADAKAFQVVAWGNVVGWIIPPLGMMLSALASRFAKEAVRNEGLYAMLSALGFYLAMASAGIGALLAIQDMQALDETPETVATTTERSWPRCQFAAIERWSEEDIATYCRDHEPTAEEIREMERLAQEHG